MIFKKFRIGRKARSLIPLTGAGSEYDFIHSPYRKPLIQKRGNFKLVWEQYSTEIYYKGTKVGIWFSDFGWLWECTEFHDGGWVDELMKLQNESKKRWSAHRWQDRQERFSPHDDEE